MKSNKNKKFIINLALGLLPLLICCLPQIAAAASTNDGLPYSLFPFTTFSPKPTDLSVGFLAQIFGNVTGVLQTGQQTILGQIFYVFNSGLLVFIGIVLIYTVFKSVVEISHPHEQMQKKFSYWQAIRVALGVGLIVPQTSGYSLLNSLIMWITIQGIGLADMVWDQAVSYLEKGGILTSAAVSTTATGGQQTVLYQSLVDQYVNSNDPSGSSDVLRALVCMYSLQYAKQAQLKITPVQGVTNISLAPSFEGYDSTKDTGTGYIYFPGDFNDPYNQSQNLKGYCGAFIYTQVPPATDPTNTGPKEYKLQKQAAAQQMITELDPIAQIIAQTSNDTDQESVVNPDLTYLQTVAANALVTAAADYQATIYPMVLYANQGYTTVTAGKDNQGNVLSQLNTDQGWIQAGRYYYDIINLSNALINQNNPDPEAMMVALNSPPPPSGNTGPFPPISNPTKPDNQTSFNLVMDELGDVNRQNNLKDTLYWINSVEAPTPLESGQTPSCTNFTLEQQNGIADCIVQQINNLASNTAAALALPANMATELNQNNSTAKEIATYSSPVKYLKGPTSLLLPNFLSGFLTSDTVSVGFPMLALGFKASAIVFIPLNHNINKVLNTWVTMVADQQNAYLSPVVKLQSIGMTMIRETVKMWKNIFITLGAFSTSYFLISSIAQIGLQFGLGLGSFWGVASGTQAATTATFQILNQGFVWLIMTPVLMALPVAFAVSLLFITMGAMLAYYIPLVPFMLFLFGVIAWLICVFEAMAASPIIALAITYPEGGGHDIFGKAEKTIWLLLSVFLRPVFLVIGLIAAIILTYVSVNILNVGFSGILQDLFYAASGTPSTGNQISNIWSGETAVQSITAVAMVLMYMLIVLALYNQCNSVINTLVNRVMQYIGEQTPESGAEHALSEIKQEFGRRAEGLAGSVEHAAGKSSLVQPSFLSPKKKPPETPPGMGSQNASNNPPGGVNIASQ